MSNIFRLLVVDDDNLNLGLFSHFLTQLGHQVTAVDNPFEAIDHALKDDFHLIISDVQMPGMSGIEASQIIRKNGFKGPIIALTAHLSAHEEQEILRSGLDDVLIKPVTKKDLDRLLKRWLETPAQNTAVADHIEEAPTACYQPAPATNNLSLFDEKLALKRADNRPDLARELFDLYFDGLPRDHEALLNCVEEGELDKFKALVHKMNGGVRFCGFPALEQAIDNLETSAKTLEEWHQSLVEAELDSLGDAIGSLLTWHQTHPDPF